MPFFVTTLKGSAWLATSDGRFATPPSVSIDQLPADFELNQKLINALGIRPDPSQQAEHERQAKSALAMQLGISLEDADFIRQNRVEFEQFRQTMLRRAAHRKVMNESPSRDQKTPDEVARDAAEAGTDKRECHEAQVRSELFSYRNRSAGTLCFFVVDEEEDVLFCQMCLDPMPFVRRNGEECGECVDLFTQDWAEAAGYEVKVMTALNLVLCPVCSEIYRDYVHRDAEKQTALYERLADGETGRVIVCDADVRRDHKECVLHFNQTHLGDIRDCLHSDSGEVG